MARKSVVMDGELRYFEVSVPTVETLIAGGTVKHVLSHYAGDFAEANVYRPLGSRSLEQVRVLAGAGALTEIKEGTGVPRGE